MNWAVGVEVGESATESSWHVTQASSLAEDEQRPGRCWVLTGPLDGVDLVDRDRNISFSFPSESFRIFKLVGAQHDRGRHLKYITRGRFLVVTPLDWERNPESAGLEIVAPEYVIGASYRAHHLDVSDSLAWPIVFDTPSGRIELPTQVPGFELQGDRLADSHPEAGPLFCGTPPQLRRLRNTTYRKVVLGEEGPKRGIPGWRTFGADFEDLRPGIAARGAGWFFIRLYDEDDLLIDSMDFRFTSRLRTLEIETAGPVPDRGGHRPALVQALHDKGLELFHKTGPGQDRLLVRAIDGGSSVEIPPLPKYDDTAWLIREPGGRSVEVWFRVDRLWWALTEQGARRSEYEWTDRPLPLEDGDVLPNSTRAFRIRLPPLYRGKGIYLGVEPKRWVRPSPVAGTPDELELPCRELGRFPEIERAAVYSELKIWLAPRSADESPLGQVIAMRGLLAEDMSCVQKTHGPNIVLEVSWKEKGSVPEKVLRLWHDPPRSDPISEQSIRGAISQATLQLRHLRPGRYLLQLARTEPLAATAPAPPTESAPNTLAVQVVSSSDVRTDEIFLIEAVEHGRGIRRGLQTRYLITILGKIVGQHLPSGAESPGALVKTINEGWYCGRLEVPLRSGVEPEFASEIDKSNPVKCEYSLSDDCVTTIEDRHGDGAMYCSTCARLYWDAQRLKDEERQGHALHGPVALFRIRWNP